MDAGKESNHDEGSVLQAQSNASCKPDSPESTSRKVLSHLQDSWEPKPETAQEPKPEPDRGQKSEPETDQEPPEPKQKWETDQEPKPEPAETERPKQQKPQPETDQEPKPEPAETERPKQQKPQPETDQEPKPEPAETERPKQQKPEPETDQEPKPEPAETGRPKQQKSEPETDQEPKPELVLRKRPSRLAARQPSWSPTRGRLYGFNLAKYGEQFKVALKEFVERVSNEHTSIVEQPKFHTVKDAEGNFQSTLKLNDKTLLLLPDLREKTEFEGEKCASKKEADNSAAKAFWDDPRVLEIARTLKPSRKAQKIREHFDFVKCKEQREAKRKAPQGDGSLEKGGVVGRAEKSAKSLKSSPGVERSKYLASNSVALLHCLESALTWKAQGRRKKCWGQEDSTGSTAVTFDEVWANLKADWHNAKQKVETDGDLEGLDIDPLEQSFARLADEGQEYLDPKKIGTALQTSGIHGVTDDIMGKCTRRIRKLAHENVRLCWRLSVDVR
ncbi:unnamed protein product [Cladocopium goreaui]|uniref:Bacterial repeat domain-containing protein n=1 Tax=Cladocopium goreaui TaxID=2562237 RepID=A0A9P1C231_9DINO|nr:unnamed protein product [Cladocopium goreaui]